jgi:hypothetical protein
MRKLLLTGLFLGLIASSVLSNNTASAAVISEGFEGASYDLAGSGAGTASLATASSGEVHSGLQSVELSLTTSSDYARVKLDTSSSNLSLGGITSADYWVDRTEGAASSQLPYILFSITTPGSGGDDNTLAVMYNNPISTSGWTDLTVGPSTEFHVEGDTTGLSSPEGITLSDLASSTYSPGVSWGSFAIDFVRIGYGLGGNDTIASTSFVDDLTINYVPTPEPASLILFAMGVAGILLAARRRRRR